MLLATQLLDKINYQRLAYRVRQTIDNPNIPMKMVLFEYDYTRLRDAKEGVVSRQETVGGKGMHVHYVVHTDSFRDVMQCMFCSKPGFSWFHRNRRERDGNINLGRRQVVLVYAPPAQEERPPSPITAVDEFDDMPPLINAEGGLYRQINQTIGYPPLYSTIYQPNIWQNIPTPTHALLA